MLNEESDVSAKDKSDIGCIPNLQLTIHPEDGTSPNVLQLCP